MALRKNTAFVAFIDNEFLQVLPEEGDERSDYIGDLEKARLLTAERFKILYKGE